MRLFGVKIIWDCWRCYDTGQVDTPDGPWWNWCECDIGKLAHVKYKLWEAQRPAGRLGGKPQDPKPTIK